MFSDPPRVLAAAFLALRLAFLLADLEEGAESVERMAAGSLEYNLHFNSLAPTRNS